MRNLPPGSKRDASVFFGRGPFRAIRRGCLLFLGLAALVLAGRAAVVVPESCYLFAYFTSETGGLRLAWSADGYSYSPLNNGASFLVPSVGENRLMRDPSIVLGPDNVFRLVWTTGWSGRTIGYSSSTDLRNWSPQVAIPIWSGHADFSSVTFTWAPEITYDAANSRYLIVWASNISGRYSTSTDGYNPREYAATTTDFSTFTSPRLFFEPGYDVIDAVFLKEDSGSFRMCFKNESQEYLQLAASASLDGAYGNITPSAAGFTPAGVSAEGPTVVRIGTAWVVFYDAYRAGRYGASKSTDLVNWTDISSQISIPAGAHHGTIIKVPGSVVQNLIPSAPPAAPTGLTAAAGLTEIKLSWTAPDQAFTYNVKRATQSGGPYTLVASNLATPGASDAATPGTVYYYIVTAVNSEGESAPSGEVSAVALPAQPRLRLAFNEASGTLAADATGNGWAGTLTNGPLWTAGRTGNAVNLDGIDDSVSLPSGVVGGMESFTVAFWVNLDAAARWSRVFDFGTGTAAYMFLAASSTNGKARFAITSGSGEQTIDGAAALPVNAWTHVAVAVSGRVGILYVNGTEVGRNSALTLRPKDLGTTTRNWLGRSQFTADPYLDGRVEDFRIYAGALGPAQIAALAAPAPGPAGLTATPGSERVALTWSAVANASAYTLRRSTAAAGPYEAIWSGAATAFTDTGAASGTTYFYVVSATLAGEDTLDSGPVSVVPAPGGAKLSGLVIGTSGSFNNSANTIAKVFDGDLATFFDGPAATGCWAGLDLSGKRVITQVRYAPRAAQPARMTGGVFQGANASDFSDAVTLFTVATQPATGVLTARAVTNETGFRYVRYLSPVNGWGNVAEVEFMGYQPALTPLEAWRQAYFGTTEATGAAADDADPDGDAWLNAQEFASGTDPRDGASRLRISQLERSGNDILVSFPTVAGKTYRLEVSDTLKSGSWVPLPGDIAGTGGIFQATHLGGALQPARFYRVVVLP